jgi:predicted CXXCH cytochrome family protein
VKSSARILGAGLLIALILPAAASVRDSLHNLSASGPGSVKANAANEICSFCHISHSNSTDGALWARGRSTAAYTPYSSSTAVAQPGQPTGTSVLCLSCHDGTIALGEVLNRGAPISMAGGNDRMPQGKGLQGTDLSDDHPISFEFSSSLATQNGELALPGALNPRLRLDENGELQCTTCHDAHSSPYPKLLHLSNIRSQLCIECHRKTGWQQTSHSQSSATWNGRPPNPWQDNEYSTVRDNGCENCHVPHAAEGGPRLLKHANEENVCSDCHNGGVADDNVMSVIEQSSAHRVQDTTMVHDPAEPAVSDNRHVECVDCHNPHATQSGRNTGDTPAQTRGVNLAGGAVKRATFTYEICLRCHGDSTDQPPARTPRQHDQSNMRLKMQPDNPSFHPVAAIGRNNDVPSLISPQTEQSMIKCIDCHNSDQARSVGGTGPEGPHGSAFDPILARNYVTVDNSPESPSNYALCYNCHSRDSILGDQSFADHDKHIREENTPCNVCHVVSANSNGLLRFVDQGSRTGSCDLLCHGEDHDNFNY